MISGKTAMNISPTSKSTRYATGYKQGNGGSHSFITSSNQTPAQIAQHPHMSTQRYGYMNNMLYEFLQNQEPNSSNSYRAPFANASAPVN